MPTNAKRAQWADRVLTSFQVETHTDREDALPDLLCHLMHLAEREGWDFAKMLRGAEANHSAEVAEPEPVYLIRPVIQRPIRAP